MDDLKEIKIDAKVYDGEPYIRLVDLLEWMLEVYDELNAKEVDVQALYAVMKNLHAQSIDLRKQIEDAKKSNIMDIKKTIEDVKNDRLEKIERIKNILE